MTDSSNVPCTTHPQTLTRLRCTECETPICPRCMVMYEVGFKCLVCARKRPNSLEQVQTRHWLAAGFSSLGFGWLYGWLHPVLMSVGLLWFLGLPILAVLVTYALGQQAGRLSHRVSGHKRHRGLAGLAFSSALLGAFLAAPIQSELGMLWSVISSAASDPAVSGTSSTLYVLGQGLRLLGLIAFLRGFRQAFRA
ncbi:B-box zinc finger protein [Vampirovibrio chlorellavorus]|uniref:B-box zinc finger protein n=1 Tax=Vampirovibrio chlorellavorus TaxID=758823 RepID=UPI0026F363E5|nr:B-box zinc finger protein [Vampirovibrio chlorellavorus]